MKKSLVDMLEFFNDMSKEISPHVSNIAFLMSIVLFVKEYFPNTYTKVKDLLIYINLVQKPFRRGFIRSLFLVADLYTSCETIEMWLDAK